MFPDIIGNNRYFNDCLVIQTFILMALLGGVYVPCIIGLLPDKKRETYDVFFGLIHDYLDAHQLPNTFADQLGGQHPECLLHVLARCQDAWVLLSLFTAGVEEGEK